MTVSTSSLLREGAIGLASSSAVLGVRRSVTWNQMSRIKVWVFLTTSDHAVLPVKYCSYPLDARYEMTKPMTTPSRRIPVRFQARKVELWLGRTQHGQHYVRDSQVNMRAQRDCRDGYHAYHASIIIRGKPRLSIPVAKRVCSNTAGHILQNYLPRLCQETENINDDYIPQYRYQTSMQRV